MCVALALASIPAMTLVATVFSVDAGLWAGAAVCAGMVVRWARNASPALTVSAFAGGMLLTSLALVSA